MCRCVFGAAAALSGRKGGCEDEMTVVCYFSKGLMDYYGRQWASPNAVTSRAML